MPYMLAQCCSPQFPEEVIAVMRTGGKCMVHSGECKSLLRVNPARKLPAYWSETEEGIVVSLVIIMKDRPGFLADITKSLYQSGVNIVDMHTSPFEK